MEEKILITDEEFGKLQQLVHLKRELFAQYGDFTFKAKLKKESIEGEIQNLEQSIVDFQTGIFEKYNIPKDAEVEITPDKEITYKNKQPQTVQ